MAPTVDCWLAWLQSVSFGVSLARRQGAEAGKAGKAGKTGKASKTGKGRRIEEKAQVRDGEQESSMQPALTQGKGHKPSPGV